MREYKIIESAPYCCVCAAVESILNRHGYTQNQFDLANYAGITVSSDDLLTLPKALTNVKTSNVPLEWGLHLYDNTLNNFFLQNSISLKETFIPANQLTDWNFESMFDAVAESYDILLFFSHGILYKEGRNSEIGHCALYVDKKNNDIVYQDPGPSNLGLNSTNIDSMLDAIKYKTKAGSGISIISNYH